VASVQEKYRRFLASAPETQREIKTIEIYHVGFADRLLFVADSEPTRLTLEPDAPRDAGSTLVFTPLGVDFKEPSTKKDLEQVLTVTLGGVGMEVAGVINRLTPQHMLTPIDVVYRKYYSGDTSAPVRVMYMSMSSVQFAGYASVRIVAEGADLMNKPSGIIYDLLNFPTLKGT